jgi:hypothetical protein
MRYMLLIYVDEHASAARSAAEIRATTALHAPYIEMLRRNAQYLGSDPLGPARAAQTLRSSGGKPIITDGPFAESREQLGGFYLIEAPDLDQAIAAAARCPAFETVAVAIEIRPIPVDGPSEVAPPATERPSVGRYLLAIYGDEAAHDLSVGDEQDDEARRTLMAKWDHCVERLRGSRQLADARALAPSGSATTLCRRDGRVELIDGPFLRSVEQIRGTCVVWAHDMEEAVTLASAWPDSGSHAIEVRPIRSAGG